MDQVVFLKNDCEKGDGVDLAKKYEIYFFPTFIVANAKGEVVERWAGYENAATWAERVGVGLQDRRTLVEKKTAYDDTPTLALARTLADQVFSKGDFKTAVDYLRQARDLDPTAAGDYTAEILEYMGYGSRDELFSLDEVIAEADRIMASDRPQDQVNAAGLVIELARGAGQVERAIPYLEKALAASENSTDEDLQQSRTGLLIHHALLVEKNEAKAVELRKSELPEDWQEQPRQLNRFAWWCFENNVNLDEAKALALHAFELTDDDGMRANILDTVAEICNARGDCKDAIAHIKKAIELSPDRAYYKRQLEKFEEDC